MSEIDTVAPLRRVDRGDGVRLAARHLPGRGPTLMFLPGYMSDMTGTKAAWLIDFAQETGRACLLLDYSGCGRSEGAFDDGTIRRWAADARAVANALAPGPLLLVGSSMGGWIMLHLALDMPSRVAGMVGIAAAPDFTRWGLTLTVADREMLRDRGHILRPSAYADAPYRYSRALLEDGPAACLLHRPIALACPVRLIHGLGDRDVPPAVSRRLLGRLESDDVELVMVKNGDHRMSSPRGLQLLREQLLGLLEEAV